MAAARPQDILSDREGQIIMEALAYGQGDKGFSDADLGRVLGEMRHAKLAGALYDLVIAGEMDIILRDDGAITYLTRPDAEVLKPPREGEPD